jgi:very-short-patch-repair endonuclease
VYAYRSFGTTADARVAARAAGEWGVLSRAELRACGLTDSAIATRVRTRRLHRLHHAVYAVGHAGLTMRGRFLAAVKACGEGAVLSHRSAAALWDLLPWDEGRKPDVIARGKRRVDGVAAHRSNKPPPQIRFDRIPVTTPARTLADLSSVLPFKPHRRAVREALARNRITRDEAAKLTPAAPVATRSELEDLVLDLIEQAGFEAPQVNRPLANGYVPDFRWPDHHLILEADGAAWHKDRDHDAHRQARLEADGERVIRVTYAQALERPDETVKRLEAAGIPRIL